MLQTTGGQAYANQASAQAPAQIKGTAVDSINASIESLTGRIEQLSRFAARISDGLLGVAPTPNNGVESGPRAVTQSTQEHIKDLEAAFERLSAQINRLG